jgi:homoserine kinase
MEKITVRVPATTANLGVGFDTLGCALNLYNILVFTPSDHLSFTGCDEQYQTPDNLSYQGFSAVYSHMGQPTPGVNIDIYADIPVCRGLGSSAAMIAAGAIAANSMGKFGFTTAELLSIVTPIEGHPDNLAPAFFGGLTASMLVGDQVYTVPYPVHPELKFVLMSPDFPLSTHAARSVLPQTVPFKDAVSQLSRLAILPKALELGDEELIAQCLDDRLHQPYRFPLIDESDKLRQMAEDLGCKAFCISGAGPTLLCLTRDAALADKLSEKAQSLTHHWQIQQLDIAPYGAVTCL